MRLDHAAGFVTVNEATAYVSADSDDDAMAAHDDLAKRMRELAAQVVRDGGWAPSRLAAAVGSDPQNGTFKRALGMLLASGEWDATGATRGRRVCPSDLGQTQTALPMGLNGLNEEADENLDSQAKSDGHDLGQASDNGAARIAGAADPDWQPYPTGDPAPEDDDEGWDR